MAVDAPRKLLLKEKLCFGSNALLFPAWKKRSGLNTLGCVFPSSFQTSATSLMVKNIRDISCSSKTGVIPGSLTGKQWGCPGSWYNWLPTCWATVNLGIPDSTRGDPLLPFLWWRLTFLSKHMKLLFLSTGNTGERARLKSLHQILIFLQANKQDLCHVNPKSDSCYVAINSTLYYSLKMQFSLQKKMPIPHV